MKKNCWSSAKTIPWERRFRLENPFEDKKRIFHLPSRMFYLNPYKRLPPHVGIPGGHQIEDRLKHSNPLLPWPPLGSGHSTRDRFRPGRIFFLEFLSASLGNGNSFLPSPIWKFKFYIGNSHFIFYSETLRQEFLLIDAAFSKNPFPPPLT